MAPVLFGVVVPGRAFADLVGLVVRCADGDRDSAQDGDGAGQGVGPRPALSQAQVEASGEPTVSMVLREGENSGPVKARTAGALILHFALQTQHIRHLTADQLTENGGETYLTVGRHPILLPPRLGAMLQSLASRHHS